MRSKEKQWRSYCRSLNLNPLNPNIRNNEYYQKGFEEWERLQRGYYYYNHMLYNS